MAWMTEEEASVVLDSLVGSGKNYDFSYRNGILISRKELYSIGDDRFAIFHGIDGSVTEFTREQAVEVLTGKREAWDGESFEDDLFACEKCYDTFDIEDSVEQDDGELWCPKCSDQKEG